MELIPAIDIKDGRCVRLFQGDFDQTTVYADDPQSVARRWVELGATRLHLVDLDGARAGHPVNTDAIMAIIRAVSVPVQLGGGLRTEAAVQAALDLGVTWAILGTAAVRQPELINRLVSRNPESIIVGVDARDGLVAIEGWLESEPVVATDLIDTMAQLGVQQIVYTDISRDGTLTEPNFGATGALVRPGGPAIIASGGVCKVDHVQRLAELGVAGAIIGKALYTGDLDLSTALATLR